MKERLIKKCEQLIRYWSKTSKIFKDDETSKLRESNKMRTYYKKLKRRIIKDDQLSSIDRVMLGGEK